MNTFRLKCRSFSQRMRRLQRKLIYLSAEFEALTLQPGDCAYWRSLYLKNIGTGYSSKFFIGPGFWIMNGNNLTFGERCSLGEFARIMDHSPIKIGDDFIAATGLQINSGTHDPVTMAPISTPITIGNRVWCGANVTIIAGAKIGNDVVIGAGAVVRTNVPDNSIAVGVPAKVVKSLSRSSSESIWTWIK